MANLREQGDVNPFFNAYLSREKHTNYYDNLVILEQDPEAAYIKYYVLLGSAREIYDVFLDQFGNKPILSRRRQLYEKTNNPTFTYLEWHKGNDEINVLNDIDDDFTVDWTGDAHARACLYYNVDGGFESLMVFAPCFPLEKKLLNGRHPILYLDIDQGRLSYRRTVPLPESKPESSVKLGKKIVDSDCGFSHRVDFDSDGNLVVVTRDLFFSGRMKTVVQPTVDRNFWYNVTQNEGKEWKDFTMHLPIKLTVDQSQLNN